MLLEAQVVELLNSLKSLTQRLVLLQTDLQSALSTSPKATILFNQSPRTWAHLYERPFLDHVSIAVVAFGLKDQLRSWAQLPSDQLQQRRLSLLAGDVDDSSPIPGIEFGDILAISFSMLRNLVAKQTYGLYINELVARVRENGDVDAFFKAVRIDRTVLICPTFSYVITAAEIDGDQDFFGKLSSALKEPKKNWDLERGPFKLALQLLRDTGALETLTQESAYRLLYEQTSLYKGKRGNPPDARSLWARIQRWRSLTETKSREKKSS